MAYLDVDGFRTRTIMPSEDVDFLEATYPGFLDARLAVGTSLINARLQKRYVVPLVAPVSETVLGWLTAIVTPKAYQKRGWNPSDAQSQQVLTDETNALAEMKEAADSEEGLFELPVKETDLTSAVSKGGPLFFSETSPYVWTDSQATTGRDEDSNA